MPVISDEELFASIPDVPATGSGRAAAVGITGATGRQVLAQLLARPHWVAVTTFGRRPLEFDHPKLTHHVVDFADLSGTSEYWKGHDTLFNCLGTTRKAAGSAAGFVEVEVEHSQSTTPATSSHPCMRLR